jgi:hypothetical protein
VWERLDDATKFAMTVLNTQSESQATFEALMTLLPEANAELDRLKCLLERAKEVAWRFRAQIVAEVGSALQVQDFKIAEVRASELAQKVRWQQESVDKERYFQMERLGALKIKCEAAEKHHERLVCFQETDNSEIERASVVEEIEQEAEVAESMARLEYLAVNNSIQEIKAHLQVLQQNSRGWNRRLYGLLCRAVENGWATLVRMYIELGVDLSDAMTSTYAREALLTAAEKGDITRVQRLLDQGVAANDAEWDYLFVPSIMGHKDVVCLLLERRASPDGNVHRTGRSPLHCCLTSYQTDIASLLLEHRAQVDVHDDNSYTPLMQICARDDCDDYQVLLPMAQLLLENRADANVSAADGWSPLFLACACGNALLAQLLIDRGAAVEAYAEIVVSQATEDSEGSEDVIADRKIACCSPLTLAAQGSHLEIVRLLETYGASMIAAMIHGEVGETLVPLALAKQKYTLFQTVRISLSEDGCLLICEVEQLVSPRLAFRTKCVLL